MAHGDSNVLLLLTELSSPLLELPVATPAAEFREPVFGEVVHRQLKGARQELERSGLEARGRRRG
jgi:hypothetical protein